MAFCKNCGANMDDSANVCSTCGTPVTNQNFQNFQADAAPRKGTLNTGFLIWSIVNIVLCCMPLGIAGLVFTITAQNKPTIEEEQKALKSAKIFNLIGTIVGAVLFIGGILAAILVPTFFASMGYNN